MKDLTAPDLIEMMKERGHRAALVRKNDEAEPDAVNIWFASEATRVPSTTVWFPRPDHPNDEIVWGTTPNTAHRDITAEGLAEKIEERWS